MSTNYYLTPVISWQPFNRKGWFSNTSFTTGLKTLPTFRPDALVFFRAKMPFFALKKTRASGRNVGKVFNPVVKLVLENQPFLMPEPAEKPSLQPFNIEYPSLCVHPSQESHVWDEYCGQKWDFFPVAESFRLRKTVKPATSWSRLIACN